MENEITTVNDIVTKAAEENNKSNQDNNGDNQQQSQAENDLAAQVLIDAAAKAAEGTQKADYSELFKELGVDNLDALKEKLKAPEVKADLTPEEKEKQDNIYKANVQKHAVESGVMNMEDLHKLEVLKSSKDIDLVFEGWKESWKEENEDTISEDEDWETTAREEFAKEYKLTSENEKAKKRGEDRLAKEANELRSPLIEKYEKAKSEFDTEDDLRKSFPDYDKKVRGFVNDSIPEKFAFYEGKDGEEDIKIDIDLTKEDRAEILENIAKKIQNTATFSEYKKGNLESLQQLAKDEADRFIFDKYKKEGLTKVAEEFLKIGRKKGSEVGATQPFAVIQEKGNAADRMVSGDARTAVLDSLNGK